MRVVGGVAKGRRLKGAVISGARPTTELARGAIFNALGPLDGQSTRVLDLYAGTGSLGIEALSRGATWADFVESHPRQCSVIRDNLAATNLADRASVHCVPVEKALTLLRCCYQLVMIDPPYKLGSLDRVLLDVAESEIMEAGATAVVGHPKQLTLRETYDGLSRIRTYRYGGSIIGFFEMGEP